MLAVGALTGLLGANAPWFVLLMIPAYGFLQQSVLHRPLQERATRDPKTGLLHYNAWQRQATDEIRRLNAAGGSWAVLFADIDHFRFYNQRHGHLGGDDALELVAQIITARVRPKDIIARFGGEEFCVLLPDTVADHRSQIAERVRVAVGNETSVLPEAVTVSVGVAAVEGGNTPMELAVVLALADQALYEAKLEGRNTVRMRLPVAPEPIVRPDPGGPGRGPPGPGLAPRCRLGRAGAHQLRFGSIAAYQIRTRSAGSSHSPSPAWTSKAAWNSSRLRTTWLQRNSAGECGSIDSSRSTSASRILLCQAVAQDRKNRCAPVSPSMTSASRPSSEIRQAWNAMPRPPRSPMFSPTVSAPLT